MTAYPENPTGSYLGAVFYLWRKITDRRKRGLRAISWTLHLKLASAMLLVLALDAVGYLNAVYHVSANDKALLAILAIIFTVVALLTIAVGLILPGVISYAAIEVSEAADHLAGGTLADFSRAMLALAASDLEEARVKLDFTPVVVRSRDEVGDMASSFNRLQQEIARAARGLDGAREGLREARHSLEQRVEERTQAEREARQAADAANRSKDQFLANISHDLRTPLNAILGYTQILLHDDKLTERQVSGLKVISRSGEHLLSLINDLLDFAKIEARKLDLDPRDVAVAAFLSSIAEIVSVRAAEKNLDFEFVCAPNLPSAIRADEKRLRQVLLNLLDNAIKFTKTGYVRFSVTFTPPGTLCFEVEDTGIGVESLELDTIFAAFARGQNGRVPAAGTGLGLAICRDIVRLMGAEIHVHSQVGQGSCFWFKLETTVSAAPLATVNPSWIITGYKDERKKVMVVDDVLDNRAVLVDMLTPLGFVVTEAKDGADALEKASAQVPDLVLVDLVMPDMDGLETIRRLRCMRTLEGTPVIVVSASASRDDSIVSLAGGGECVPRKADRSGLAS
ncbi:hypothetical protein AYM40_07160 [Paraburkholderia phytofirmans OLGA172]|uniref:histidine kinase n=1 Tax=Paraburkholderia phytofirmans OLGA172 TaxID=1417228 RepID=A0A160FIQ6_9BURK|nr:ATP-binding protein [Paraburkholderia phytofirmans]ANB72169.1 hypothetical protein AYM40_07160 [Paraburkholderia phytofirmans OLGA172]